MQKTDLCSTSESQAGREVRAVRLSSHCRGVASSQRGTGDMLSSVSQEPGAERWRNQELGRLSTGVKRLSHAVECHGNILREGLREAAVMD